MSPTKDGRGPGGTVGSCPSPPLLQQGSLQQVVADAERGLTVAGSAGSTVSQHSPGGSQPPSTNNACASATGNSSGLLAGLPQAAVTTPAVATVTATAALAKKRAPKGSKSLLNLLGGTVSAGQLAYPKSGDRQVPAMGGASLERANSAGQRKGQSMDVEGRTGLDPPSGHSVTLPPTTSMAQPATIPHPVVEEVRGKQRGVSWEARPVLDLNYLHALVPHPRNPWEHHRLLQQSSLNPHIASSACPLQCS